MRFPQSERQRAPLRQEVVAATRRHGVVRMVVPAVSSKAVFRGDVRRGAHPHAIADEGED
eukprot:15485257-Alexandrium_andersonii.AAC.1